VVKPNQSNSRKSDCKVFLKLRDPLNNNINITIKSNYLVKPNQSNSRKSDCKDFSKLIPPEIIRLKQL